MKKKTAPKGVPMPNVYFFLCSWRECDEGEMYPCCEAWNWPASHLNMRLLAAEYKAVLKWLSNPAMPKGVRR